MAPPKNAHLQEHVRRGQKPIAISSAITTVKSVRIIKIKVVRVARGAETVLSPLMNADDQ